MDSEDLVFTYKGLAERLTHAGYPIRAHTLDSLLRSGFGPPILAGGGKGKIVVFHWPAALAWAETRPTRKDVTAIRRRPGPDWYSRNEIVAILAKHGIPYAASSLNQLASRGDGPPCQRSGKTFPVFYQIEPTLAWARARKEETLRKRRESVRIGREAKLNRQTKG